MNETQRQAEQAYERPAQPQPSTIKRIMNFVRFWIHIRANVTVLLHNQAAMAHALQTNAALLNRFNSRISWYENRVPFIKKEYYAWLDHEKRLIQKAQADQDYAEREKRRAAEDAQKPQLVTAP